MSPLLAVTSTSNTAVPGAWPLGVACGLSVAVSVSAPAICTVGPDTWRQRTDRTLRPAAGVAVASSVAVAPLPYSSGTPAMLSGLVTLVE